MIHRALTGKATAWSSPTVGIGNRRYASVLRRTPDIHLRGWALQQSPMDRQIEMETLGRNLDSNYFADLDHAQQFFESGGFTVESRPLLEGIHNQITAPQDEGQTAELNDRRLFVLTPRR